MKSFKVDYNMSDTEKLQLARKILAISIALTIAPLLLLILLAKKDPTELAIVLCVFALPLFIFFSNIVCKLYDVSDKDIGFTSTFSDFTNDYYRRNSGGLHSLTVYSSLGSAYQNYATRSRNDIGLYR